LSSIGGYANLREEQRVTTAGAEPVIELTRVRFLRRLVYAI
jgi:hypothetical protein